MTIADVIAQMPKDGWYLWLGEKLRRRPADGRPLQCPLSSLADLSHIHAFDVAGALDIDGYLAATIIAAADLAPTGEDVVTQTRARLLAAVGLTEPP